MLIRMDRTARLVGLIGPPPVDLIGLDKPDWAPLPYTMIRSAYVAWQKRMPHSGTLPLTRDALLYQMARYRMVEHFSGAVQTQHPSDLHGTK